MSKQPYQSLKSTWGKLSLGAGALAVVLPVLLFVTQLPARPGLEQGVLTVIFALSLATCSLVGTRWPFLGLLILPVCFFGLASLACWWVLARTVTAV